MTDQELADRLHAAVGELNDARAAAVAAGLRVSVDSFVDGSTFVAYVQRVIPSVVTDYPPAQRTPVDIDCGHVAEDDNDDDAADECPQGGEHEWVRVGAATSREPLFTYCVNCKQPWTPDVPAGVT